MASIQAKSVHLRGGACHVRSAVEADAAALLDLQNHVVATDPHTVREPGEQQRTLEEQTGWVRAMLAAPAHLLLVAAEGGEPVPPGRALILGALSFRNGDRRKVAHHGHFGIGVRAEHRGRGVGSALIGALLDWAAEGPILEKICLGTLATNTGAQRLYQRMGFVEESRSPRYFKLGPGKYVDDIQMAMYVKPGIAPAGFNTWRGVQ